MELSGLLTSAGINIGICVILFSLYSVLRKQPSLRNVYFARTLAHMRSKRHDPHWFDRFVPSPSWILKAWKAPEEDILAIGGLDAAVFVRVLVFSIRIFSVACIVSLSLVLPLNYFGKDAKDSKFSPASLEAFTIQNIPEGSRWLWAHCLALYIICFSACILLYFEYKNIIKMRLEHISGTSQNVSRFAVVVRGIPWSSEKTFSDSLKSHFTKYHASSYLSHQMVYRCSKIQKMKDKATKMYDMFSNHSRELSIEHGCARCGFCEVCKSLSILPNESEATGKGKADYRIYDLHSREKECAAAFVFFKTRYAAASVAEALQCSDPMLWVTDLAPEPRDVYWSNLCVPYTQFWVRRMATLLATIAFLFFFLAPVTLAQSLANLPLLQKTFPFLRGLLKRKVVSQLVTGYIPSVILILFFYLVPPLMILFSTTEGYISRSGRKMAACSKVLYFTIWNVFFVNLVSGTVLNKLDFFASPKDIPTQLAAKAVPALVKFFMTYVLTSGWTSLSCELVQLYPLLCSFIYKGILRKDHGPNDEGLTFPFHTELPRVLLFGLLGFSFSILAPMILPLLLIYFCLAYLVYRNQVVNVYLFQYDSGGKYWPLVHNTTIFSLVMSQIMTLGVFALKKSPVCLVFNILLIGSTLLFHEYCRHRFLPVFKQTAIQVLIEMDQQDEASGREEMYQQLQSAYCQPKCIASESNKTRFSERSEDENTLKYRVEANSCLSPLSPLETASTETALKKIVNLGRNKPIEVHRSCPTDCSPERTEPML